MNIEILCVCIIGQIRYRKDNFWWKIPEVRIMFFFLIVGFHNFNGSLFLADGLNVF